MLSQLGMEVIQVEPPGGSAARRVGPFADDAPPGDNSLYWSAYAAGKRGITCNLEMAEGRELFLRLVREVDFVFDSADPGVMQRRGLDHGQLSLANGNIITVSITAFGETGPKAHYADSELVVWAASGALFPARDNRGVPRRFSVPQAYLHGASDAAAGALLALFARHRTGRGQHVEVSAQASAALTTLSTMLAAAVGHSNYQFPRDSPAKKPSLDLSGSGSRTRRSKWQVKDGLLELHLGMGPASGGSTNKLFAWMRAEGALPDEFAGWDWVKLPARILANEITDEQLDAARTVVAAFLARFTKEELGRAGLEKGILMAPAMTVEDLVRSPHLKARNFFETLEEQGRPRTIPGRYAAGCNLGFVPLKPAPALGADNAEVYGRLGLSAESLGALRSRGVL
jgi:crotonobetainyl-CoA:carnitine CoA-transferase CaiB-like acyl-CoA transferase